jgi:glycosyltransferase involved in cell wall biosynthesis
MTEAMQAGTLALCIPAYNAAAFLPRLLGSAAQQHIPFDEVLVYDDCSTDCTGDVARSLGATVIRGERNLGCSAGKNRLLELTSCEWVHFHDADDDMKPGFTALAHKWMAKSAAPDVVLFNYESRSFETGQILMRRQFDANALRSTPKNYAVRTQINPYCGLYKVDALRRVGGYDEDPDVLYNEDCRFHMRIAFAGLSFDVEPQVEIINLERTNSMSSANRARCAVSRLAVLHRASLEGGSGVRREVGLEAWLNARHLGHFGHFSEMKKAIALAQAMGVVAPTEETSRLVKFLARIAAGPTFLARAHYVSWRDKRPGAPSGVL